MLEFALVVAIVAALVCVGVYALPLVPVARWTFIGAICVMAAASIAWRAGWIGHLVCELGPTRHAAPCVKRAA